MKNDLIGHQVLRRYRILQALGQGGMGVVYLGRTEGAAGFSRPVVVKAILPTLLERPDMADMFIREARILANLNHPGIVRVLDFGREGGRYLMVLEYVAGYDLARWRRYLVKTQRQAPTELAVYIVCQVLDALNYVHELKRDDGTPLNTVHRDVSPNNILLSDEGQVRLLDFGIASIISDQDDLSRGGGFKGKLLYAAPELLGSGTASAQSDIYSTAVVLYHLLAGKNPFGAPSDAEIIDRIRDLTPPPLGQQRADVSPALDAILERALQKNPADRYASAGQFAEALRYTQSRSDESLRQQLAECLRADFYGTLPEVMNTERLEQRDHAWRSAEVEPGALSHPPQSEGTLSGATVRHKPPPSRLELPVLTGPQRRQQLEKGAIGKRLLPSVLVGTLLGWFFWPSPQENSSPIREPEAAIPEVSHAVDAPPASQPSEGATAAPSANAEVTDAVETDVLKPTQATQLTQTVGEHSELIARCFDEHPVKSRPKEVRLGFRLRPDGRVRTVTLAPKEAVTTEFGKCIARGYQAIGFPPQGQALRFRIPIAIDDVLRAHGRIP
jgi:serine/threonine-protein kinase